MRMSILLAIVASFSSINGCKTSDERKLQESVATSTPAPLSLDPTEQIKLHGWWSNDRQLLQLRDDGGYTLYGQLNRYSKPLERGRWGQRSYAVLRLEPYSSKAVSATRVSIDKIDGRITLRVRDLSPFTSIDQPPKAVEDSLLGQWTGSGGSLTLNGNQRYTYATPTVAQHSPATLGGHSGTWSLNGRVITLAPDSPSLKTATWTIGSTQHGTVLTDDAGSMELAPPPAAATRPQ